MRADVGVAHGQPHSVDRDAEFFRDQQPERGPVVLAYVDLPGEGGDEAVAGQVDPGAASRRPGGAGLWGLEHHDQPVAQSTEPVPACRRGQIPRLGRAIVRLTGLRRTPAVRFLVWPVVLAPAAIGQAGGAVHGPPDPRVAAAAADVPGQRRVDRGVVWSRIAFEQRDGRQDHPRSAVAALGGALFGERPLHRMQCASAGLTPSMVVIAPSTEEPVSWQDRAGWPSTSTVQAPQAPSPQPGLAPVRPSWSRSAASKGTDAGTVTTVPLTERLAVALTTGSSTTGYP